MKKYIKSIVIALISFLIIVVFNFILPRLLPGDPVAYLSGFEENDMSPSQYAYYYHALHLDENIFVQFGYYIKSLFDGSLGYSFKHESTVASLINDRVLNTLQITIPAVIISSSLGLVLGLSSAYRRNKAFDKISTSMQILINSMPVFLIGLLLVVFLSLKNSFFPSNGLNSIRVEKGTIEYFFDRIYHLILPILTLVIASTPSRFLLIRNTASKVMDEKYILYAKTRGLTPLTIQYKYIFPNICQPFISMVGMSFGVCLGGSIVIENIFSLRGMGKLLIESTYTLDYPTIQGCLFVTALMMVISIIITDIICILVDPKIRRGNSYE